jgi:PhnB protein
MAVQPVPSGYHTYTPYYIVDGAAELIDLLKKAFGAEELFRMPAPRGRIGHAEVRIGDSILMMADATPEHRALQLNGLLYVRDVDAAFARATAAGCAGTRSPENMFYGDRMSSVTDKWGNVWAIATHVEDVSPAEMEVRAAAQKKG